MNIEELVKSLEAIKTNKEHDEELQHMEADQLLLDYINDQRVTDAYCSIDKWYS